MAGQVYAVLREIGPVNHSHITNGDVFGRRLLEDYRKLRQAQVVFARELGLTPAARIALKANGTRAALDLAAAMAAGETEDAIESGKDARTGTADVEAVEDGDGTSIQPE